MAAFDRNWARNQLRHQKNSAVMCFAVMSILNSDQVDWLLGKTVVLRKDGLIFCPGASDFIGMGNKYGIDLGQISRVRKNANSDFLVDLNEFWKQARGNLIKESFETVMAYAKAQKTLSALKGLPWYQFTRMVRNCISHDFHFRFNKGDWTHLPARWNGMMIDLSMQGSEMTESFLDPATTIEAYAEMVNFVS